MGIRRRKDTGSLTTRASIELRRHFADSETGVTQMTEMTVQSAASLVVAFIGGRGRDGHGPVGQDEERGG